MYFSHWPNLRGTTRKPEIFEEEKEKEEDTISVATARDRNQARNLYYLQMRFKRDNMDHNGYKKVEGEWKANEKHGYSFEWTDRGWKFSEGHFWNGLVSKFIVQMHPNRYDRMIPKYIGQIIDLEKNHNKLRIQKGRNKNRLEGEAGYGRYYLNHGKVACVAFIKNP